MTSKLFWTCGSCAYWTRCSASTSVCSYCSAPPGQDQYKWIDAYFKKLNTNGSNSDKPKVRFACPLCDHSDFVSKAALLKHTKTVHGYIGVNPVDAQFDLDGADVRVPHPPQPPAPRGGDGTLPNPPFPSLSPVDLKIQQLASHIAKLEGIDDPDVIAVKTNKLNQLSALKDQQSRLPAPPSPPSLVLTRIARKTNNKSAQLAKTHDKIAEIDGNIAMSVKQREQLVDTSVQISQQLRELREQEKKVAQEVALSPNRTPQFHHEPGPHSIAALAQSYGNWKAYFLQAQSGDLPPEQVSTASNAVNAMEQAIAFFANIAELPNQNLDAQFNTQDPYLSDVDIEDLTTETLRAAGAEAHTIHTPRVAGSSAAVLPTDATIITGGPRVRRSSRSPRTPAPRALRRKYTTPDTIERRRLDDCAAEVNDNDSEFTSGSPRDDDVVDDPCVIAALVEDKKRQTKLSFNTSQSQPSSWPPPPGHVFPTDSEVESFPAGLDQTKAEPSASDQV